jgi:hypothetical protein
MVQKRRGKKDKVEEFRDLQSIICEIINVQASFLCNSSVTLILISLNNQGLAVLLLK